MKSIISKLMGIFGVTGLIAFIGFLLMLTPMCWDYTISTWLEFFGRPDNFKLWMGIILTIVLPFGVPAAVITWILMMFIG